MPKGKQETRPKSPVKAMRPDGGVDIVGNAHKVNPVIASVIERCRAAGMTIDQTASIVRMNHATIKKYYSEEWDEGTASMVVNIAQNMAVIAMDPNHKQTVAAGKFMLSRLAPEVFSERRQIQMLGSDGQPVDPAKRTLDPYAMSDEQRELLKEALADVLKEAVDDAQQHKDSKLPDAEYAMIEDGRDDAAEEE
jgi:hypothetical protein